ncbi:hypothetical protein AG1IA_07145 [Rhizoctonia solani AG-1 IA]|uniref:Uncharacterized protein n=1 Tax=Thanatephorus cucumeris (strain AG1-IA) TaxID=983506 RepID=L8WKY5_THACA|nr:hypothetical protein AG1IA_07145 [Rhizoctonia solani AG-1 IA]
MHVLLSTRWQYRRVFSQHRPYVNICPSSCTAQLGESCYLRNLRPDSHKNGYGLSIRNWDSRLVAGTY